MRKIPGPFLLISLLVLGLGMGEHYWSRLAASGCQDWQLELQRRIESYARLHLPDQAPQVQLQSSCGHSAFADALYFRWHQFSWNMGWRAVKPLQDSDLRMAATRDLMQHPDMGSLRITVRFDPQLDSETRKKVEDLISRYLMVEEPRQKLEFRKMKKSPEASAAKGTITALAAAIKVPLETVPLSKPWPVPLLENPEPQLKTSLIKVLNLVTSLILSCLGGLFFLQGISNLRRRSLRSKKSSAAASGREVSTLSILFAPRVAQDLRQRSRELWQLLLQLDRSRAQKRVKIWWEKDRSAFLQFLTILDSETQESILSAVPLDQLLKLSDLFQPSAPGYRESQRAAWRAVMDLARDIGSFSRIPDAPLFIHLMTRREWQRVAQQLTRPRRRALADLFDKERSSWLRARQDLHPGWLQAGSKEVLGEDQLFRRIRSVLQVEADKLREQLHNDRDVIQVVEAYFADLTLDAGLNSDLAMLILGQCQYSFASFGRLIERRDPHLQAALQVCDDQQIALLLYDLDAQLKTALCAQLGSRQEAVEAILLVMEQDKNHSKSLRMQARNLQRFMERQVLVADLLCP